MNNEHVVAHDGGMIDPDGTLNECAEKGAAKLATAIDKDIVVHLLEDCNGKYPRPTQEAIDEVIWMTLTKKEKQALLDQWKLDASALRIVRRTHEAMIENARRIINESR